MVGVLIVGIGSDVTFDVESPRVVFAVEEDLPFRGVGQIAFDEKERDVSVFGIGFDCDAGEASVITFVFVGFDGV